MIYAAKILNRIFWQTRGTAEGRPCPPAHQPYDCGMRPLRYSINITLDGCVDHREGVPDEELHRQATETLRRPMRSFSAG